MNKIEELYGRFDEMYKKIKGMKERLDEINGLFEEADKRVEEMRLRHDEEMKRIFAALEKRDAEIRGYLERMEHKRIGHLLADMGGVIDELFDIRLTLLDEHEHVDKG